MSAYRKFVDTLQSELRTPAPPKPPKAPKANPSEWVSLPVLGDLGTLGAPPIKNEISLHAATRPPLSFSAPKILSPMPQPAGRNLSAPRMRGPVRERDHRFVELRLGVDALR